ncbi:hypothetical protein C8F01DRAFT_1122940 [Mycena amicta]|nr:hypothetical protein C8F01DRAFT_1122940 [Mycena amicta]
MSSLINEFPPELLSKIFIDLPYRSLLAVQRVSKKWNGVVEGDTDLGKLLFKKKTKVYLEPNTDDPYDSCLRQNAKESEPVRLHPVINKVSLFLHGTLDIADIDLRDYGALIHFDVANDFASIPTVTKFYVQDVGGHAVNKNGVRVRDIFAVIAEACREMVSPEDCDYDDFDDSMQEELGALGDTFGTHGYYDGMVGVVRTGLKITAGLELGS